MASSFLRFLDHIQRRITVGRTPLDEWSSRRKRHLPENTQHSQQINIHAPGGIRTHDLSRRAAADLRLRPRGHCDRLSKRILSLKSHLYFPQTEYYSSILGSRRIYIYIYIYIFTYAYTRCITSMRHVAVGAWYVTLSVQKLLHAILWLLEFWSGVRYVQFNSVMMTSVNATPRL